MIVLLACLEMAGPVSEYRFTLSFATTSIKCVLFFSLLFVNGSLRSHLVTEAGAFGDVSTTTRLPGGSGGAVLPPKDFLWARKKFSPRWDLWCVSLGGCLLAIGVLGGNRVLEMVFLAWLLFSCKIISPCGSATCASQKSCPAATSCLVNTVTQPLRRGNIFIPRCTSIPVTYRFNFSCLAIEVFQQTKIEGGFAAPTLAGRFTHEQMICNKYSVR